MNRFFVYKPVFGWVIAAFIALAGLLSLINLPVEQYPSVAPPSLNLSYTYTGADAETLDRNVTSVIEREMNGLDGFQVTKVDIVNPHVTRLDESSAIVL